MSTVSVFLTSDDDFEHELSLRTVILNVLYCILIQTLAFIKQVKSN